MSRMVAGSQEDMLSALRAYVDLLRQKREAIERLQRISLGLVDSLASADPRSLEDIVSDRAKACLELGELFSQVPVFEPDTGSLAQSEDARVREAAAEADGKRREVESLSVQILATQKQCEEVLRSALAQAAHQLEEAVVRRRVRSAYCSTRPSPPRFLDRRK